jgi:parallel beta-helix repeat protein
MKLIIYRKSISVVILLIFILSTLFPIISSVKISSNNIIYVDDDGTADYTKIQDAIDNASDGDTIFVYNGTYYENIIIDKSIDLIGEDTNNTIIQGDGINNIVTINSDWVDISGFNISKSVLEDSWERVAGIYLKSNFCLINNNIVHGFYYDLYLNCSSNNKIYQNIIYEEVNGIFLFKSCNNNSIFENMIYGFDYEGIFILDESNDNIICNNIMFDCHEMIMIDNSGYNIITNNTINKEGHGVGIWLSTGYYNEITNNILENLTYGVALHEASINNIIKNNLIQNNRDGINIFQKSENNIVINNIISNNSNDGIFIAESKDNLVQFNDIINNIHGVYLIIDSNRNIIIENNFENNKINALFSSSYYTTWYKNYWDQPRDTPYLIWGGIRITYRISFPWVQFDRNPAQEPYDIGI